MTGHQLSWSISTEGRPTSATTIHHVSTTSFVLHYQSSYNSNTLLRSSSLMLSLPLPRFTSLLSNFRQLGIIRCQMMMLTLKPLLLYLDYQHPVPTLYSPMLNKSHGSDDDDNKDLEAQGSPLTAGDNPHRRWRRDLVIPQAHQVVSNNTR